MKKIVSTILIVVCVATFAISASATTFSNRFEIEELGYEICFPAEYMVLHPDISEDDPIFDNLGSTYEDEMLWLEEMDIWAWAVTDDWAYQIEIEIFPTDDYNFSDMTDDQIGQRAQEYANSINLYDSDRYAAMTAICYRTDSGDAYTLITYWDADYASYTADLYTVIDGYGLQLFVYADSGISAADLTNETKRIADGIGAIGTIDTPQDVTESANIIIGTLVMIVAVLFIVIIIVIIIVIVATRPKKKTAPAPLPTGPKHIFCTQCGQKIDANSSFCIYCGASVKQNKPQ